MGLATTQTLVKEYSYFILHQTTTNSTLLIMDSIMKMMSSNPNQNRLVAAAELEPGASCEFGSPKYYALCGFGGLLSCGITHTAVTPLDLVKCRLQVNKEKYKSLGNGFKLTVAESGASGLFLGWAPTAIGYSMQGICKFGFYEFFKNVYSGIIGEENTYLYKTSLYLAASASAEFFADIALSPMESCKVRIQTSAIGTFPTTLREAAPKIYAAEALESSRRANGFWFWRRSSQFSRGPRVVGLLSSPVRTCPMPTWRALGSATRAIPMSLSGLARMGRSSRPKPFPESSTQCSRRRQAPSPLMWTVM